MIERDPNIVHSGLSRAVTRDGVTRGILGAGWGLDQIAFPIWGPIRPAKTQ
jgi:hypothetical protein